MNKTVSIIVPVYNSEKYLKRSIESILNQTYKDLEIIIIDDKSTDNSKKIIQKYASSDNRIRAFYSEVNHGVSRSRNIGLKSISGDYVMFMDSDDYIVPEAIEKMVNASIKYDADIVDNYHLIIYSKKNKEYYFTESKVPKKTLVMGSLKDNIDILTKSTYITGKLIKKELIGDLTFDESLRRYEDLVFEHNLKKKIKNLVFINDVDYYYYQVSDSLINTLGEKHIAYLDAAKEVIDNYKDSNEEIKSRIESLLVTNGFLTGVSKIVKNDKSIEENTDILFDYLKRYDKIFSTWKSNKYINKIIRNYIIKLVNNKKKVYKLIKRTKKIDFIKIYFNFLSIINKYKMK